MKFLSLFKAHSLSQSLKPIILRIWNEILRLRKLCLVFHELYKFNGVSFPKE